MPLYNRTNPGLIRPSLEAAEMYAKHGIQFVPMPVFTDAEAQAYAEEASERLRKVIEDAEDAEVADTPAGDPTFKA